MPILFLTILVNWDDKLVFDFIIRIFVKILYLLNYFWNFMVFNPVEYLVLDTLFYLCITDINTGCCSLFCYSLLKADYTAKHFSVEYFERISSDFNRRHINLKELDEKKNINVLNFYLNVSNNFFSGTWHRILLTYFIPCMWYDY